MKIFKIFTDSKYFYLRFYFVSGLIICFCDLALRQNFDLLNNWGNILLFPFACIIVGALFQSVCFILADAFCNEKTLDYIDKREK